MVEKLTDEKLAAIREAAQMVIANKDILSRNAYLSEYEESTIYDMLTRLIRRINNRTITSH